MLRQKQFKRETTHNGTLRTQVTFRRMKVSEDFYETECPTEEVFKTWAQISEVSHQDLESLKGRFSKNALALESIKSKAIKSFLTLKFRDPGVSFQPTNQDTVVISDPRYQDVEWEVIEVKPDFYNRHFLVVQLGG